MVMYAYFIWLGVLHMIGCGPDNDEMHRLLLGMAPLVVGFSTLLRITRPFPEVHLILRWLSLPLFTMLPFALRSIWDVFAASNLGSAGICADTPTSHWEVWWAPIQIVTIVLCSWMMARVWQPAALDRTAS